MLDGEQQDSALKAANLSLSGRRRREATSFASIELRGTDTRHQTPWQVAAMVAVGVGSFAVVIGLWFL